MFKKNKCNKCNRKIEKDYQFCPHCGASLNENFKKDWGMLGKDDEFADSNQIGFPRGMNFIFNSLMKNLTKQLKEAEKNGQHSNGNFFGKGLNIKISTSGNNPPRIKVNQFGKNPKVIKKIKKIKLPSGFSAENTRKFSELPREEPETSVRRFSDKIVYEINLEGVESIEDISITALESSVELKALTKNKAYFKLITINLPIVDYNLSAGKLILEFDTKS